MPIQDISKVTATLTKLLNTFLTRHGFTPTIDICPPDQVTAPALCLYLYHIAEDPHYKSQRDPDLTTSEVVYIPMALNLFYQLSAHPGDDGYSDEIQKQMGFAVKVLHDYPIIDAKTTMDDGKGHQVQISQLGTKDRLRVVLQPVTHNEAVSYWTSGGTALRLSAYYQVSVVFLEAEEPPVGSGRVVVYGVHTFTEGLPHLETSRNRLSFIFPKETKPQDVDVRPAQVPPADVPSSTSPRPETLPDVLVPSELVLEGSGFALNATSLLVRHQDWVQPEQPTEAQCCWVLVGQDSVSAVVRTAIGGQRIMPGIYAAIARVTKERLMSDGSIRKFDYLSNECPFIVVPRVDSITPSPAPSRVFTVQGYVFQHATGVKRLKVCVGGIELGPAETSVLEPGEYWVDGPNQLKFQPPLRSDLPESESWEYQVRIIVNGAESGPRWIVVP